MANLIINKVPFKIIDPEIPIWVASEDFFGAKKKRSAVFKDILPADIISAHEYLYYAFEQIPQIAPIHIDLSRHKYFVKPYIHSKLKKYFEQQNLMTIDDFVNGLQVWSRKGVKHQRFQEYEKISLREVSLVQLSRMEMLISFDGKSYSTLEPKAALNVQSHFSKYIENNQIKRVPKYEPINENGAHPVLSYPLKKELHFPYEGTANRNTYLEYYEKISAFYSQYLQGKTIADNLHFLDEGFVQLTESEIHKTKFVSNKLRFGNDNEDNSVYSGLKKYGPFAVPPTENLRFIFVYKPAHSAAAKKLYGALSQGIKESGGFSPGLKDYLKVKFQMADQHRIVLSSNNIYKELEDQLNAYPQHNGLNYFVVYLTDHKRIESESDNEEEYYRIKYILLQRGILSQFIYYKNILLDSFRYHLPNIQVAILAKLGGIPWKLDTFSSDKLIIGFGVKRTENNIFLGNSLFFKEDGTFHKFESFQNDNLNSIGAALRTNIETVLHQGELNISKLVIHYYKTLNDDEAEEIENVLRFFNLEIPYVVLTINDSKSRDYVFFDAMYDKKMPVSGTIIELRYRSEYLLSNNMRHDETQSYGIRQYPFPLKIKINKSENVLHDVFDTKQLLDQVYSFSRIYWKSIGQASLPVTISYSKIVADLASHFPNSRLPEDPVAHSNLWFL